MRFLVPEFTAAGFQGAKLTLEYPQAAPGTDGTEEEFFSGVPQPFTWRVPRPPGADTSAPHADWSANFVCSISNWMRSIRRRNRLSRSTIGAPA